MRERSVEENGKDDNRESVLPLSKLVPYVNNRGRTAGAAHEAPLGPCGSSRFINPVIIDRELACHRGAWQDCRRKEEGMEEVPCVFADFLTEAQSLHPCGQPHGFGRGMG